LLHLCEELRRLWGDGHQAQIVREHDDAGFVTATGGCRTAQEHCLAKRVRQVWNGGGHEGELRLGEPTRVIRAVQTQVSPAL
jgi:hypothetical protein